MHGLRTKFSAIHKKNAIDVFELPPGILAHPNQFTTPLHLGQFIARWFAINVRIRKAHQQLKDVRRFGGSAEILNQILCLAHRQTSHLGRRAVHPHIHWFGFVYKRPYARVLLKIRRRLAVVGAGSVYRSALMG